MHAPRSVGLLDPGLAQHDVGRTRDKQQNRHHAPLHSAAVQNVTEPASIRRIRISLDRQRLMRTNLAGRALLGLGAVVGVVATTAWFFGYDFSTLPPALLRIAAFKLTALAALGLMAAGAVVLRVSRQTERPPTLPLVTSDPASIQAGDVGSIPNPLMRDRNASRPDSVTERQL